MKRVLFLIAGVGVLLTACRSVPPARPPAPPVRLLRILPLPPLAETLRVTSLGPWIRVHLGTRSSLTLQDTALLMTTTGVDTLFPGATVSLLRTVELPPKGVCGRIDSTGIFVGRVIRSTRPLRSGFFFQPDGACTDTLWIPRPPVALWKTPRGTFWSGPLELWPWAGNGRRGVAVALGQFPGKLVLWPGERGMEVINALPMEIYLEGVVTAEMGPQFPEEALKAQAVAARTYALRTLLSRPPFASFHLYGDVRHQAYRGGEIPEKIRQAVRETRGEVLMDGDSIALVFYHANCGGVLADGRAVFGVDRPYLRARPDLFKGVVACEYATRKVPELAWFGKRERWHAFIPRSWLERTFRIGRFQAFRILARSPSGRVEQVEVEGTQSTRVVTGQSRIRRMFGRPLPSTLFRVQEKAEGVWLVGWGYGHGVGMCQVGAGGMAALGADHRTILEHYFPGLTLTRLW